jgi:serine/threonine protein kinase
MSSSIRKTSFPRVYIPHALDKDGCIYSALDAKTHRRVIIKAAISGNPLSEITLLRECVFCKSSRTETDSSINGWSTAIYLDKILSGSEMINTEYRTSVSFDGKDIQTYLYFPFANGGDLTSYLATREMKIGKSDRCKPEVPIEHGELINCFEQLIRKLSVIHASGVVHLDIKGDNIIVELPIIGSSSVNYKFIDFGLSRFILHGYVHHDYSCTHEYMDPWYPLDESDPGNANYDMRNRDIWSLAVTMIYMLTRDWWFPANNFAGKTPIEIRAFLMKYVARLTPSGIEHMLRSSHNTLPSAERMRVADILAEMFLPPHKRSSLSTVYQKLTGKQLILSSPGQSSERDGYTSIFLKLIFDNQYVDVVNTPVGVNPVVWKFGEDVKVSVNIHVITEISKMLSRCISPTEFIEQTEKFNHLGMIICVLVDLFCKLAHVTPYLSYDDIGMFFTIDEPIVRSAYSFCIPIISIY